MQLEAWGGLHELCIEVGKYSMGGGLALQLYERTGYTDIEPYTTMTVNLPEYGCGKNCAFVDINNFPVAPKLISEYKLGKPTGRFGHSGYCTYPEYQFDPKVLEKYCLNPEDLKTLTAKNKERNEAR